MFNLRKKERIIILIITIIWGLLFYFMYLSKSKDFKLIEQSYDNKTIINLDENFNTQDIINLLNTRNYFADLNSAAFFSKQLKSKLQTKRLDNLGSINKNSFKISAALADSLGGMDYRQRVASSFTALGINNTIDSLSYIKLPSTLDLGLGKCKITVSIKNESANPISGCLVMLSNEFDADNSLEILDTASIPEKTYYGLTDANGSVFFAGLKNGDSYSVLPIKKGFDFGASKGTTSGTLNKNLVFNFIEKEHKIKLLDNLTYSQIKEDGALTIRTPKEFNKNILLYCLLFIFGWWVLHFYLVLKNKKNDELVIPILMILTGVSVLLMYAIQDPLTDVMRGNEMVQGVLIGIASMILIVNIDFVKFFNSSKFDLLSNILPYNFKSKGSLYIILAFLLVVLLFIFGTGPEGSGVKINLWFFQPSEISKYLVTIFFAAYFTKNAEIFSKINSIKIRLRKIAPILLGFGIILAGYLILGDMGPALVLCSTFIIIYSVARGDFFQAAVGTLLYIALIYFGSHFLGGGKINIAIFTVIWFIIWLVYGFTKKTIFESGIFIVLVISAFIFGESLPNVGQRLKDRNDIYNDLWQNQTYGGDQVAHGIWSLSAGGFSGQGLGEGNSKWMPANHTDMILASIGEEIGWVGLLLVVICFALLLHRCLLIGRKSAHPFTFYLSAAIVIVTGIQFIIISAGSLGIMPLTGITVPFLSFGRVSMAINLAAFGVLLSISGLSGSKRQSETIQKQYDNTIALGSLSFTVASFIILAFLFNYQVLNANKYIIKTAFTVNKLGEPIASRNPRINLLLNKLVSGNIYDRNGLILATNYKDSIQAQKSILINAGIDDSVFAKLKILKQTRYYPFQENMFFWVGDYNTRLLWGDENKGYFSENRNLTYLRGFDTKPEGENTIQLLSNKYRENRFSPVKSKSFEIPLYDYAALIPLLKAGINSNEVKQFNLIKKDLTLTVDAKLQTALQKNMEIAYNSRESKLEKSGNRIRASIVIMNGNNGEVLSSALYPLPKTDQLKALYDLSIDEQVRAINRISINNKTLTESDLGLSYGTQPGSTAKVISALAGFNFLGNKADEVKFYVSSNEIIRAGEPIGDVSMKDAITKSSNLYFINLLNKYKLDKQLAEIYNNLGVEVDGMGKYIINKVVKDDEKKVNELFWISGIFASDRDKYQKNKDKHIKDGLRGKFSDLAWGQSEMKATPIVMCRAIAAIANNGKLETPKYILSSINKVKTNNEKQITLTNVESAAYLESYLKEQENTVRLSSETQLQLFGKTGTPQRIVATETGSKKIDDAWFMFYVYSDKLKQNISICIRIERIGVSRNAETLAKEVVIPTLKSLEYIK